MVSLSKLISALEPSPTFAASQRASQLKAQGKDIVSFTLGEPDFDTPQHVKDAAVEALNKGFTKYTAVAGILPLREAICSKLKRDQGVDFTPSQIVVTNGGKQALAAACAVLLNPGDEAVIPSPYWTSYPDMVKLAGAKPMFANTQRENGYILSGEALLRAITPRTKMIFLNSPSNPTGACYSREQLREWADALSTVKNKHDIVVISDEVYEYLTYDGFKHVSFATVAPEFRENTLIVNAFSKTYSMTGWRVGYIAGPKHIIAAVETHQSQFSSNVCSIAQYAALKAYDDGGAFPRMMLEEFTKRLHIVNRAVREMPGVQYAPAKGAFYAMLDFEQLFGKRAGDSVINSGSTVANYLLERHDVATVQGEAFGLPTAVRISFALSTPVLEKGLTRIAQAVSQLN